MDAKKPTNGPAEMYIHGELQYGKFQGIDESLEICCELEFFYDSNIFTIRPQEQIQTQVSVKNDESGEFVWNHRFSLCVSHQLSEINITGVIRIWSLDEHGRLKPIGLSRFMIPKIEGFHQIESLCVKPLQENVLYERE